MADSAIAITAGSGTNVDTRTESTNGQHRQVVVLGDPAVNAGVAPVDATKGLAVDLTATGQNTTAIKVVPSVIDDDDFTDSTSAIMPIGAVAESASPTTVTEGDFGAVAMTLNRALKTSEFSPGGNSIYGSAGTAALPVQTVQGIASMTPLLVSNNDGAGNALTSATRGSERALSVQIVDSGGNQVTSFGGSATTVSTKNVIAAATDNAQSVKASAGTLYGVLAYNNADYTVFLKFHNTAGTPTAGSGVVFTVPIQSGQMLPFFVPQGGRSFSTGIGITLVKDMALNGTTAVAASDALIEIFYA